LGTINALSSSPGRKSPFHPVKNCVPIFLRKSFSSANRHFPLCPLTPRESSALPCQRESPSHPPGAKDHVSGILDSSAERSSGEVVAENWNSVPHGRWSLLDRRVCELSVQRLVSVVRYSQQISRVNVAIEGPRRKLEGKKENQLADRNQSVPDAACSCSLYQIPAPVWKIAKIYRLV